MIFSELRQHHTENINLIFSSYCQSFPEDERRSEEQFFNLFNHKNVRLFAIEVDNEMIGYIISWNMNNALFIEHFEVFEAFRNKKYGSKILSEFSKIHPHLILESEPSNLDEIASRRIAFYERNGFKIIDENYTQPAYGEDKNSLNLYLMSNFSINNLDATIKNIHQLVYSDL